MSQGNRNESYEEVRNLVWRVVNESADHLKREKESRGNGYAVPAYLSGISNTLAATEFDYFCNAFTANFVRYCSLSEQEYILLTDWLQKNWKKVKEWALLSLAAARTRIDAELDENDG